jgi:hypothetical protein
MACIRSAWLVLGSQSVPLENTAAGYFCSSLDLGYPQPREVTSILPARDGLSDRTRFMGGRVVTIALTAMAGAGAVIDAVAAQFAPYMVPSARPVLHYVLDRPGVAERTLVLRGSGYAWPIAGAYQRDVQLQFLAADPVIRDPTIQTVTAWAGSSTAQGRTYPLTFPRLYPSGGAGANTARLSSAGDVPVQPLLRIYGPITAPVVYLAVYNPAFAGTTQIVFLGSFSIAAGAYVEVDTAAKTARINGDPTQSVLSSINWTATTWPVCPVAPGYTLIQLTGSSTSGVTQVQAIWQDGYLT